MSKKPVKRKAPKSSPPRGPQTKIILFGLDEKERPRGAQFVGQDEALLARMAKGLGLRMGTPVADYHLAVTNKLPEGDVHATGLKAVPQIPLEIYEKLNALVGGDTSVIATKQPTSHKDIAPGHLVIAEDSFSDGWWPAVVRKRHEQNIVLMWRDHPSHGEFVRHVNSVAILAND